MNHAFYLDALDISNFQTFPNTMYPIANILLGLVFSGLAVGLDLREVPALPTDDSFYYTPANISSYQPGDIIASRLVSTNLNGILGVSVTDISLAAAYQFLYRTTDGLKNPIATVTTILVPHDAQTGKLLAYQTAYDSANINCSPSYSLQAGANNTAIVDIVVVHMLRSPLLNTHAVEYS